MAPDIASLKSRSHLPALVLGDNTFSHLHFSHYTQKFYEALMMYGSKANVQYLNIFSAAQFVFLEENDFQFRL
jgi:hypothetical protein